jgi:heptosyltransferase-2/heptosyltransferase-3
MGIKPGDRLIMINTGGNWDLKQWPETLFVTLVREIHRRGLGRAVLPGAGKDVERVKRIAVSSGVDPVVAAGETSIASLAGLMAHCSVMVTADTGPLHVAAALGLRTVALFGPTRPEVTGPRGQVKSIVIQKDAGCNRAPCYNLECPDNKCMKTITVEDVLSAIGKDPG